MARRGRALWRATGQGRLVGKGRIEARAQRYIKASNTGAGDFFGYDVALSGDGNTLAVGARYEDSNATGVGGNQADDNLGKLTTLTAEQAEYLGVSQNGPFKPEAYRY